MGIRSPKPAMSNRPCPTSLTTSSKSCSSLNKPPAKKQKPRHSNKFASMEPRIAARMTGMRLLSTLLWSRTMKRTISTMPPRKLSSSTPMLSISCILLLCIFMPPEYSGMMLLTKDFWKLACELLSSKTDKVRRGNHCNVIEDEVPQFLIGSCKMHHNSCRYERPEYVDC